MALPAPGYPDSWGPDHWAGTILSIDTVTIRLGLVNQYSTAPEDIAKLREAGKRYRSLAEMLIVASVPKTNELIPTMMAGRIEQVRDNYISENPKIGYEWWISWIFMRAVNVSKTEFAEMGKQGYHGMDHIMHSPQYELHHGPSLAAALNIGALVQSEYPDITVKEFTPNNDGVNSTWMAFAYNVHSHLRNKLAISFVPLMFLQEKDLNDVTLAIRWPSEESNQTHLNWYIRLAAQMWTGRDEPMVAPTSVYMDTYVPPSSNEEIGETIYIYSGDKFLEIGKDEARENGAALRA